LCCTFSSVAGFKVSQPPRCSLGFIFRFHFSVSSPTQIKTLLRFFFQHKFFPCRVRSSAGPASLGLSAGRPLVRVPGPRGRIASSARCRRSTHGFGPREPVHMVRSPFFVLVSRAGCFLCFLLPVFDSAQVSKQFGLIPRGSFLSPCSFSLLSFFFGFCHRLGHVPFSDARNRDFPHQIPHSLLILISGWTLVLRASGSAGLCCCCLFLSPAALAQSSSCVIGFPQVSLVDQNAPVFFLSYQIKKLEVFSFQLLLNGCFLNTPANC
jgi:hypothetical protein